MEERERLCSFLDAGSTAAMEAPLCLRVSLRSSSDTRVAVDLFHVPVPGASQRHLLAIKEDAESRQPPEAACLDVQHSAVQTLRTASRRASSASSRSSYHPMPELSEVLLMADASSEQLELQQAHLSFLQAGKILPSMRQLIRPTDWQTVRDKVRRYVQSRSDDMKPLLLKQVGLRVSARSKETA